jgi:hypothetical protein
VAAGALLSIKEISPTTFATAHNPFAQVLEQDGPPEVLLWSKWYSPNELEAEGWVKSKLCMQSATARWKYNLVYVATSLFPATSYTAKEPDPVGGGVDLSSRSPRYDLQPRDAFDCLVVITTCPVIDQIPESSKPPNIPSAKQFRAKPVLSQAMMYPADWHALGQDGGSTEL